jgi:16S rRNA (cytidine1402-2'-O)-methyltransferase
LLLFMLLLVATPLGNLSDITYRAIETLNSCDYILCEDTRHSARLLSHYKIVKPCRSFHKFNEKAQADNVIADLHRGLRIAVISDAGTPGISDPGQGLVARAIEEGILVSAIPGPCAAIAALTSSGLSSDRFQFCGFLPRKEGELKKEILQILDFCGTSICYESPRRLIDTLKLFAGIAGDRKLVVARELTKIHEEILHGTAYELLNKLADRVIKGEIVLLIDGRKTDDTQKWESLSPQEHVQQVEKEYQLTRIEAIKLVAKLRGLPKREVYREVIF